MLLQQAKELHALQLTVLHQVRAFFLQRVQGGIYRVHPYVLCCIPAFFPDRVPTGASSRGRDCHQ
jgi:hypothetical protein